MFFIASTQCTADVTLKGFGYGLYDGISGLVTQPVDGARSEGVVGFVKGVGKGLSGVVLKPSAGKLFSIHIFSRLLTTLVAVLGVPGYTYKGVYKELRKSRGKNVENFIIAVRMADGLEDLHESTALERDHIVSRWHEIQAELRKTSAYGKHPSQATQSNTAV